MATVVLSAPKEWLGIGAVVRFVHHERLLLVVLGVHLEGRVEKGRSTVVFSLRDSGRGPKLRRVVL